MIAEDEWFKIICESYIAPPVLYTGRELPGFPSDTIQANTTGQAGVATLKEAFIFYQDCIDVFKQLGHELTPQRKLLDFGMGWGRISRFFLRDMPLEHIYGIDVMAEFVRICRQTFNSEHFLLCNPFPPTEIPPGKMSHIVGYSVFSHLSEKACFSWMEEFHRILAPGGIVALTTRGRPFLDYCERLKDGGHHGYLEALSKMFPDFNEARRRYDKGEFVHSNSSGVTGNGAMNANFYGETFIPEEYASRAYSDFFTLEKFVFNPSRQTHPIMFFRRR